MFAVGEYPGLDVSTASVSPAVDCAIKFHNSLLFLPGGTFAFALGTAAIFRKVSTGKLGVFLLLAHVSVAMIAGLALTIAAAVIVAFGPISMANGIVWVPFDRSEIWAGVIFTTFLLVPAIFVAVAKGLSLLGYNVDGRASERPSRSDTFFN